jgi:hypothetical protein
MTSRIVAGTPSIRPTHVQVGDARTARITRASTTIPNALKTARLTPSPSRNG